MTVRGHPIVSAPTPSLFLVRFDSLAHCPLHTPSRQPLSGPTPSPRVCAVTEQPRPGKEPSMSAINSVGSSTAMQYADQLRQRQGGPSSGKDFAANMKSMFESAAKTAGVSESDLPGLMEKVQKAVETARSSGSKDPSAIKAAVEGVLKDSGVDVAKFDAAMEAQRPQGMPGGKRPSGPPPAGGPPGGAHGPRGGDKPQRAESTDETDSTEQTELEKLIEALTSGTTDEDKQSLLALIKQQSSGTGTLLDIAA